jgi:tRNA(His) 5'-end guanylyltransferase
MKTIYKGDSRYEKIYEQMQLLGIQDVSTPRQVKNGTIAWRLPIKNNWPKNNASYIEQAMCVIKIVVIAIINLTKDVRVSHNILN